MTYPPLPDVTVTSATTRQHFEGSEPSASVAIRFEFAEPVIVPWHERDPDGRRVEVTGGRVTFHRDLDAEWDTSGDWWTPDGYELTAKGKRDGRQTGGPAPVNVVLPGPFSIGVRRRAVAAWEAVAAR